MRIVIDLQVCQLKRCRNRDVGRYSLELAKAMVKLSGSHDFWILTNTLLGGQDILSDAFRNILPLERIIAFDIPAPVSEVSVHSHWRTRVAERVRQFMIAQIEPDILHIASLFEGFSEEIVASICSESMLYPTVVTLHDGDLLTQFEDSLKGQSRRQWYEHKLVSLRNSSALLTLSEHTRQQAASHLNFPQERIFGVSTGVSKPSNMLSASSEETENTYSNEGAQAPSFLWEALAEQAIKALESTHRWYLSQQRKHTQTARLKEKLAFVSPLPPLQSGISDYSADLIPKLAEFYDVVVITNQAKVEGDIDKHNLVIKDVDWFRENAKEFTRIVYQFGNSPFHQHMFDLLQRYPGVVVLHDFYLSSVVHWMSSQGRLAVSFSKVLYESHGYPALRYLKEKGDKASSWLYPCNKGVLDRAVGIIVHSNHAKQLAQRYFGQDIARHWVLIPQPYAAPAEIKRHEARISLGFREDDFVVCSFGMLGPTKLNHRLLKTWLTSNLASNAHCHLIFVGKNHEGDYGKGIIEEITQSECQARVEITGFLDSQHYHHYLAAADAVVQLRTLSRGETSRAILETLSYGIPLIANRHGSVTDYPEDTFLGIPDDFSDSELIDAIMKCRCGEAFRRRVGQLGKQYVLEQHSPAQAANAYYTAVEELFASAPYARYKALLEGISEIETETRPDEADLIAIAETIARNDNTSSICQLLIDVSEFLQAGMSTDEQNAMGHAMRCMFQSSQGSYRIEPVYFDGSQYRYARNFTTTLLNLPLHKCLDDILDVTSKDFLLGIDGAIMTAPSMRCQRLAWFSRKGVQIHFVNGDLWSEGLRRRFHEVQKILEPWLEFLVLTLKLT
ncbi:MAG: hypothetical protein DCF15_03275 [Phormidesmis priestleyi]|uniref:Glycosyl transferase family 1 n=1 Tax=Phormidesmis priestleyi TaxID=268141 RepID=A0A2W4XRU6_9CYAN|nr:MAG: hypothetical protein DCF15_03275 [Phormidesmis priestleyi]